MRSVPMKKGHPFIPALLAVIAASGLAFACANPMSGSAKSAGSANTGSLSVEIPAIATWLQTYQSNPTGKNAVATRSRAMAVATSVKIEVLDSGSNAVIAPWTMNVYTNSINSTTTQTVNLIPVGTGYTVKVSVYNSYSSTSVPMVSGQTGGVNITDGATTPVSVHCTPISPSALTLDGAASVAALASYAEQWYSLSVTSGVHYYFQQTSSTIVMGIFNSSGTYISSAYDYIDYAATFTGTLYVGAVANGSGTSNLTVSSTAPVLNEGGLASPVPLALNTAHLFKAGPSASSQSISYYSFTTTTSGTYALDTAYAYFTTSLYSNPGFTAVVVASSTSDYGITFTGLSALATYYLKITNNSSVSMSMSGQIADPATISANTDGEGSIATPVPLTIDSSWAGKVGNHSYNDISYYSFTTGSGVDYRLTLSSVAPSPSSSVWVGLYGNASYTTQVGSFSVNTTTGASLDLVLTPSTVYYLAVSSSPANSALSYSLEVGALALPIFNVLTVGGGWTNGSMNTTGGSTWYQATVVPGQSYSLYWDDSFQGSGAYSLDVVVSAYQSNRTTPYFTNDDSGYTTPWTFTVPAGQTVLYVKVAAWSGSDTGTFALKLQ